MEYLKYIGWALIQQAAMAGISYLIVYFTSIELYWGLPIAVILFTAVHIPNWPLMVITFLFSLSLYTYVFINFEHWWPLMPGILIHGLVGEYLRSHGFNLSVLWSYKEK